MVAVVLTVVFIVVVGAVAFRVWKEEDESASSGSSKAVAVTSSSDANPESLEGVLVMQLRAGRITQSQYLRAMAHIAARDEERHPLAVPPEVGPADT
jgi:hypothetical protein